MLVTNLVAGTLVWTNNLEHVYTFENELVFVSAFANSIMAEIGFREYFDQVVSILSEGWLIPLLAG
jgi:hypothetical protein